MPALSLPAPSRPRQRQKSKARGLWRWVDGAPNSISAPDGRCHQAIVSGVKLSKVKVVVTSLFDV
jgi:hypothetical protein